MPPPSFCRTECTRWGSPRSLHSGPATGRMARLARELLSTSREKSEGPRLSYSVLTANTSASAFRPRKVFSEGVIGVRSNAFEKPDQRSTRATIMSGFHNAPLRCQRCAGPNSVFPNSRTPSRPESTERVPRVRRALFSPQLESGRSDLTPSNTSFPSNCLAARAAILT